MSRGNDEYGASDGFCGNEYGASGITNGALRELDWFSTTTTGALTVRF